MTQISPSVLAIAINSYMLIHRLSYFLEHPIIQQFFPQGFFLNLLCKKSSAPIHCKPGLLIQGSVLPWSSQYFQKLVHPFPSNDCLCPELQSSPGFPIWFTKYERLPKDGWTSLSQWPCCCDDAGQSRKLLIPGGPTEDLERFYQDAPCFDGMRVFVSLRIKLRTPHYILLTSLQLSGHFSSPS